MTNPAPPSAPRRAARRRLVALAAAALAAGAMLPVRAQDEAAMERRVKAAFLYKFVDYVAWPDGTFARSDTPVTIGVAGDDDLAAELAQVVANRFSAGRPLAVRRVREGEPTGGLQMLFVARAEQARLGAINRATAGQPIVLVTEAEGAFNQGSVINFVASAGRMKFEIALDNAERRGLRLSSRLLTVAQAVRPGSASP